MCTVNVYDHKYACFDQKVNKLTGYTQIIIPHVTLALDQTNFSMIADNVARDMVKNFPYLVIIINY